MKPGLMNQFIKILRNYNIAVTVSDTPSWPMTKEITADFSYIRFHGPAQLFSSLYSQKQIKDWSEFILTLNLKKAYIYFNNDINAYAIENAMLLKKFLKC